MICFKLSYQLRKKNQVQVLEIIAPRLILAMNKPTDRRKVPGKNMSRVFFVALNDNIECGNIESRAGNIQTVTPKPN